MRKINLEICLDNLTDAKAAEKAGVDRIELCSALEIGGLTPSQGLIAACSQKLEIGVHVMIRPRRGDFLYHEDEFQIMLRDIALAREAGAGGIVTGLLLPDASVDTDRMVQVMHAAGDLEVTFHRAFDMIAMPDIALEELCAIGVDRILTSGAASTALAGIRNIAAWRQQANNRLTIMAGAGINAGNAADLIQKGNISDLHFSARAAAESGMSYRQSGVLMGATEDDEYTTWIFDDHKVAQIKDAIKNF